MIGVALTDCVGVSLFGLSADREDNNRDSEAALMSPVRLPVILLYSSLITTQSAIRFIFYLIVEAFYGADPAGQLSFYRPRVC